jgi:type VI secretion system protein ImpF
MPKFRPSLLDTLMSGARPPEGEAGTGKAAEVDSTIPGMRLYSLDRMEEPAFLDTIRRDLGWLLNTVRLDETTPLDRAPEVARSVLNYGIPDFSVRTYASINVNDAAETMAEAVRLFEPRIAQRTLEVKGEKKLRDNSTQSLVFHIYCDIGNSEDPVRAGFKTEIDVETGDVKLERR